MDIKIVDMEPISQDTTPHLFEEVGVYKNVTIQILRCPHCGEMSIGWFRQADTETIYEKEDF